MAQEVKFKKEFYTKESYNRTINTDFTEIGVSSTQEQIAAQPTVQEFFDMYNDLFYQINEFGPTNSHEFLVKTSGEYISFEETDNLITALQNEIATLRKELLETQQQLANSLLPEPVEIESLPEIEDVEIEPITPPIKEIIETPSAEEEEEEEKVLITKTLLNTNLNIMWDQGEFATNKKSTLTKNLDQARNWFNANKSLPKTRYQIWQLAIKRRSTGKRRSDLLKLLNQTNNDILDGGDGLLSGT